MNQFILFADIASDLAETARNTAGKFGFDWPHFVAQVINFLIVSGVLVIFAYKPILTVLEERRKRIADGLANAEKIKHELARTEAARLEVFSILFRPVSLSFRLYGNIFAGENMLEAMSKLVPYFGWLLPIPFSFMELLVGFVQALVFMLLTAVFTMLICEHEEGREAAHH